MSWPRRKAALVYPIPPAPRTAVLIPGYRSHGRVRAFSKGTVSTGAFPKEKLAELARFAPQAIAGTLEQLDAVAETGITLSHAIVVMGTWEDARVTEADRERLWMRFRVPVFEQIISGDGVLLAAECEAHNGLHIETEGLRPDTLRSDQLDRSDGWQGMALPHNGIDRSPCVCGRKEPRLISAEGAGPEPGLLRCVAGHAR
jgi:hypothetical protein